MAASLGAAPPAPARAGAGRPVAPHRHRPRSAGAPQRSAGHPGAPAPPGPAWHRRVVGRDAGPAMMPDFYGDVYAPVTWERPAEHAYRDIRYETSPEAIAKITINRPEVRNAFRPQTLFELSDAFNRARDDDRVGGIVFTGEGTEAFCSGGDQRTRGDDGYMGDDEVASKGIGR